VRTRAEVEAELTRTRAELLRVWPNEKPGFALKDAPSKQARETLQRLLRLQDELDSLPQ
jgi:hypothetical protein